MWYWQSALEVWIITLEEWPRSVPQRCEGLSLVILIANWGVINGTAGKGLSKRIIINAGQRVLIENRSCQAKLIPIKCF